MIDVDTLVNEALEIFGGIDDADELEGAKARYLGKAGVITELRKTLGKLPPEERPAMGARFNVAKDRLEEALRARREAIQSSKLDARLKEEALDVTLPGRGREVGTIHPVMR